MHSLPRKHLPLSTASQADTGALPLFQSDALAVEASLRSQLITAAEQVLATACATGLCSTTLIAGCCWGAAAQAGSWLAAVPVCGICLGSWGELIGSSSCTLLLTCLPPAILMLP